MTQVNMFQAKTELSKLVALLESGGEDAVIIARSGKPVAKLVPYRETTKKRIGVAKGEVFYRGDLDEDNEAIAALFGV